MSTKRIGVIPKKMGAYSSTATYGLMNLVTNDAGDYFESLQDNNTGHALTDTDWWMRRSTPDATPAIAAANSAATTAKNVTTEMQQVEANIKTAEASRMTAENNRVGAESSRVNAEKSRVTAETNRASAESVRATAETNRASAESARATAETARETASATAVSNAEAATKAAQAVVDNNATIIDNLSDGIIRNAEPYDAALPTVCGQPMILLAHGTPSEDTVPLNWMQYDPATDTGYNWNGLPCALGQQYINIDATANARYIAVPSSSDADADDTELTWKNI
jgi:hypothetical protein